MDSEWSLAFGIVISLAALGFVAGLGKPVLANAARTVVVLVAFGYVTLLVVTGIYVAACPGCTSHLSYDSARIIDLIAAIFWGAVFLTGIVALTWLGSATSSVLRRLFR